MHDLLSDHVHYITAPSQIIWGENDQVRLEPHHEKTCFLHMQKRADQLSGYRAADQRLCFQYMDSTLPLLPKF